MNEQEPVVTENKGENEQRKNSFLGAGLAVLLASAAFFSGLQIGTGGEVNGNMQAGLFSFFSDFSGKEEVSDEVDMSEFWEVWDLMEEKFVSSTSTDTLTVTERIEGAIAGLVDAYDDPYTVFLPPVDASMLEEDISGNFSGVGMEVGIRDGLVTVISPLPDTPASRAGIVAQDVVMKIDEKSTDGMTIDEAVRLIRGEKGTEVVLTIYREGEAEKLVISVTRDTIDVPTVDTEVRDDVFIITLYSFNALADAKMQEALVEYANSGKKKMVLDLRGNPGGFLQSAISIASFFVPGGEVVVREGYGDDIKEDVYRSSGRTLRGYAPEEMIVLVDGGSASASEIVAGALQEHGVATLMGQQTFGKGSVQELVDLPSGSSLKVTIARWFTPNGVSISDGGLTPDVLVERTPQQFIDGIDPQIDAAIAWLNGDKTVGTTTATTTE